MRKFIIWSIIIIVAIFAITAIFDIIVSKNTSGKTYDEVDSIPHPTVGLIDSTVSIFDISIHLDEKVAISELSAAGILKCDTIFDTAEQFRGAVIEFAGVKFGLNRGFVFITSKQDKHTIESLVSKITSYYGAPEIDDNGEPEFNYYHWNMYNASSDKPCIRIRPLHSDEGGLVMTWSWS